MLDSNVPMPNILLAMYNARGATTSARRGRLLAVFEECVNYITVRWDCTRDATQWDEHVGLAF